MTNRSSCPLLLSLAFVAACSGPTATEAPEQGREALGSFVQESLPTNVGGANAPEPTCSRSWRWLAHLKPKSNLCPPANGFSVRSLGDESGLCIYEDASGQPVGFPISDLPQLQKPEPDCKALPPPKWLPLYELEPEPELDPDWLESLSDAFAYAVEAPAWEGLLQGTTSTTPPVELAHIDGPRLGGIESYQGNVRHADYTKAIASTLGCDRGTCLFDQHVNPAMVHTASGLRGTAVDIAEAVAAATATAGDRTVLHIPLGFGLDASCDYSSLAVQALRSLIVKAACQGVLVVAAAGNAPAGASSSNPMFPAAWEHMRWHCDSGSQSRPLLIGVGATQLTGEYMTATGAPSVWAPGVFGTNGRPVRLGRRSGTSIASAVVASLAAMVWEAQPQWSAAEVIAHLQGFGSSPDEPLSACEVLTHACKSASSEVCALINASPVCAPRISAAAPPYTFGAVPTRVTPNHAPPPEPPAILCEPTPLRGGDPFPPPLIYKKTKQAVLYGQKSKAFSIILNRKNLSQLQLTGSFSAQGYASVGLSTYSPSQITGGSFSSGEQKAQLTLYDQ